MLGLLQFPFRPKEAEAATLDANAGAEPAAAEAAGAAVLEALRGMRAQPSQAEREEAPEQVQPPNRPPSAPAPRPSQHGCSKSARASGA